MFAKKEYRQHANCGIYCIFLLPIAFAVSYFKLNDVLRADSYWLTASLIYNYLFITFLWIISERLNIIIHVICFVLLSSAVAFIINVFYLSELLVLFAFVLLSSKVYVLTLNRLPSIYRSCFTFGEMVIVLQASIAYISTAFACFFCQLFGFRCEKLFCSYSLSSNILQIIFVGVVCIAVILLKRKNSTKTVLLLILAFIILITYLALNIIFKREPVFWLFNFIFIDENRTNVIIYWGVILSITLLFTYIYVNLLKRKATTIARKFYHISISLIILIGLKYDQEFLMFASSAMIAVFVIIEVIRILDMPIIGNIIDSIIIIFRDEKDAGILTLTHIYLLIGCCFPIWLYPYYNEFNSTFVISSGVITVGFGDTAASLGGYFYGKHHWNNSPKTYEGTLCSIIAQIIGFIVTRYFLLNYLYISLYEVIILFIISTIIALIEAKTTQIDNLTLPLFCYILTFILLE